MATMNVSLPDQMKSWVEEQTRTGLYANSSDYVRDLIRRDQEEAAARASLQAEIDKGLASGPARALTAEAFKRGLRPDHG